MASLVAQTVKDSACTAGDLGSFPGFRKIPWRRALQYAYLENSIDRGAWQAVQSMGLQRVGRD